MLSHNRPDRPLAALAAKNSATETIATSETITWKIYLNNSLFAILFLLYSIDLVDQLLLINLSFRDLIPAGGGTG